MRFSYIIAAVSILSMAAGSALAENAKAKIAYAKKSSCSSCSNNSCGSKCSNNRCNSSCSNGCSKGSCSKNTYRQGSRACRASVACKKPYVVCGVCGSRDSYGSDGRCRRCGARGAGRSCWDNGCGRRFQSHRYGTNGPGCWHNGYAYTPWGVPAALVVPPTADFVTNWGWGVGNTRINPIYAQFGPNWPGVVTTEGGRGPRYLTTPPQPSDTTQYGVNYVRGPW